MSQTERITPEEIVQALQILGTPVSASLAGHVAEYIELLLFWNAKMNLTSVSHSREILEVHFAESFFGSIAETIDSGDLLDVGSGAGFPALPIVMFRRRIRATLLEPSVKKAAFLAEVSRKVDVADRVKVVRSRLEDFPADSKVDFITSRAVRVGSSFLRHCPPLLKPGGKLVLWLSLDAVAGLSRHSGWRWEEARQVPFRHGVCVISGMPVG